MYPDSAVTRHAGHAGSAEYSDPTHLRWRPPIGCGIQQRCDGERSAAILASALACVDDRILQEQSVRSIDVQRTCDASLQMNLGSLSKRGNLIRRDESVILGEPHRGCDRRTGSIKLSESTGIERTSDHFQTVQRRTRDQRDRKSVV